MPLDVAERNKAFRTLQPLLVRYAKRWKGRLAFEPEHALGYFSVEVKGPRAPQFATLFAHVTDVRFYIWPIRVWPDLRDLVPASLRKRIVLKCVFAFKTPVTASDRAALAKVLAEAAKRVQKRMELAPQIPYTKKLTATQVAALEAKRKTKTKR